MKKSNYNFIVSEREKEKYYKRFVARVSIYQAIIFLMNF